jgi:hypothetical protein
MPADLQSAPLTVRSIYSSSNLVDCFLLHIFFFFLHIVFTSIETRTLPFETSIQCSNQMSYRGIFFLIKRELKKIMKNFVFHDLFELRSYGSKHEKKSLAQYHVLQFNSHYIKRIIVKKKFFLRNGTSKYEKKIV